MWSTVSQEHVGFTTALFACRITSCRPGVIVSLLCFQDIYYPTQVLCTDSIIQKPLLSSPNASLFAIADAVNYHQFTELVLHLKTITCLPLTIFVFSLSFSPLFVFYRLALYVYEYLLHVGAQKSAQTFLSEVRTLSPTTPRILPRIPAIRPHFLPISG